MTLQASRADVESMVAHDVLSLLPKDFPAHNADYGVPPDSILVGSDAFTTGVGAIAASSTAEATAITAAAAAAAAKLRSPSAAKAKPSRKTRASTPTSSRRAAQADAADGGAG